MRFLVDECTGSKVAQWLQGQGHEVFSVYDQGRGMTDNQVIQKAFDEKWILITNDKDFGEKIYREHYSHSGIVFLRLQDERAINKIEMIHRLLEVYSDRLSDNFVVVTEKQVRFAHR